MLKRVGWVRLVRVEGKEIGAHKKHVAARVSGHSRHHSSRPQPLFTILFHPVVCRGQERPRERGNDSDKQTMRSLPGGAKTQILGGNND